MKEYLDKTVINEDQSFDIEQILRYVEILKQRRWVLLTTFIVVLISGIIYTFNVTPVYKATTTIIIEADIPQLVNIDNISTFSKSEEFFQTQLQIINSISVAEKTMQNLIASDPGYIKAPADDDDEEEKPTYETLAEGLIARTDIETEKNTRLVKLSIKNTDPQIAANEVNTLAKTYINYNLEDRKATSNDAFVWLSEQLAVLKAKVEKSEMDLLKYQEAENIVSLEKRQLLLEERIAETNDNYSKTTTKHMELETMLAEIKKLENWEQAESLPRILENPLVQQLKQQHSDLENQLAQISKKYKAKHPKIVNLETQITSIQERIKLEIDKTVKSIEIEAKIFESNIHTIENNLSTLKLESMGLAKQAIQYGVLKREAESNKNMYDVLLHRLKETDISGKVTANNIRIVDVAKVPQSPFVPNTKMYLMVTLFLAIVLGVGISLFIDFVDNTIKSEDDIRVFNREIIFGVVPVSKNMEDVSGDGFNHFSRAYNEIKSNISFYQKEHVLKTVLLTSSEQSEGKTTSVYNIAKAYAKTGYNTLMVDADLFRPQLGKLLKMNNNSGISDYILDNKSLNDIIFPTTEKNLSFLPSGLIPPNPAEVIGSEKMKHLFDQLKHQYNFDVILIDSPPINSTNEVSVLSSYMDGVILTIKAQHTTKQDIRKAIANLKSKGVNMIGTLLTSARYHGKFSYYYQTGEKADSNI
jgi:capsular exopolysaccharide synthesis family protein